MERSDESKAELALQPVTPVDPDVLSLSATGAVRSRTRLRTPDISEPVTESIDEGTARRLQELSRLIDTATLACQRALQFGDPQMAKAAVGVLATCIDRWLTMSGQATRRTDKTLRLERSSPDELLEQAQRLQEDLRHRTATAVIEGELAP
jgi:hypothetical protein